MTKNKEKLKTSFSGDKMLYIEETVKRIFTEKLVFLKNGV